jgi:hypothetical protein
MADRRPRDPLRDPFDAEFRTKCFARSPASIPFSEGNWRVLHSTLVFRLLPKLDVVGSSPIARSLSYYNTMSN